MSEPIEEFEAWWEESGQYGRAGGGSYEKSFAWNAWQAARSTPKQGDAVCWIDESHLTELRAGTEAWNPAHAREFSGAVALFRAPSVEPAPPACCQDFGNCNEPCVPRSNYWQAQAQLYQSAPQQVEPGWVIEYEASQDGCVQYTSPSEIMARAHAEAEGAWAFEIFEVKRRKLAAPKEPKP